ncbi:MAG: T9SS type A sorting domain-containing protein [Bacteroidota bacterium]|nr:T9SS type A sorting domain-containing protein [Bacteroidota bacterium]
MNFLNLFLLPRHWLKVIGIICFLQSAFIPTGNAQSLIQIMAKYGGYDMDKNGTKEIESLSYLPFEAPNSQEVPANGRLVLVLVEPRLLQDIPNSTYNKQDLLNRLERWKGDLRAEGYYTRFIAAKVYDGSAHQDGRTVLAMRKFLQDVYSTYPNLKGVMLVGSFPEAMLVREWLWKREKAAGDTLTVKGKKYTNISYIRSIPERVSHRTDIVLADLNGKWENTYQQEAKTVSCLVAIPDQQLPSDWPATGTGVPSPILSSKAYEFFDSENMEDFFYVKDSKMDVVLDNGVQLNFRAYPNQHPELSPADRLLLTPTAQPEISVSRINTRHIALDVLPGIGLIDGNGKPQTYTGRAIDFSTAFQQNPVLERTLLIEYFDRNHLHRIGAYNHMPLNLAATAGPDFKAASAREFLNNASLTWNEQKEFDQANLEDYLRFLKYNAVVKGYRAHGSRTGMSFYNTYDPQRLLALTGPSFRWTKKFISARPEKYEYKPTFEDKSGSADWGFHRTLWQNKKLTSVRPSFYFFFGCEANSPANSEKVPYNHSTYGQFNNAENILYFLNGLATMTRAKTFNDDISGFPDALKKDIYANLGDGWKAHYSYVATHTASSQASNKRSYWWSVLGDWTLRLQYSNGAAILGFNKDKPDFEGKGVLAQHTWIGSNQATAGEIELDLSKQKFPSAGDLNNDKREDFLITHEEGIAAAYHDGLKWQTLLAKPNDTFFGAWRYNASINTGKDKILGHGDFDNNGSHEILIRSSWGLGILAYSSASKTFTSILANPAGTVYTDQGVSWTYQTTDIIEAIADFNGDKTDDILIRNSKGRAVLSVLNGKLYPLMVVKFGTSSAATGGKSWKHEASDVMVGVADFAITGNTKSILLLHATKGLGIMNVTNSLKDKFLVHSIQAPGTRFGDWLFNPKDNKIEAAADFNKDGKDELVFTSPFGIGLITLPGSFGSTTFTSLVCKPKGTSFNGWSYSPTSNSIPDKIIGTGDFDADGAAEILIRGPQALGVLKLNALASTFDCPEIIFYNNSFLTKSMDGWYPQDIDLVLSIGNFDGLTGQEILLVKNVSAIKTTSETSATSSESMGFPFFQEENVTDKLGKVHFYPNPVENVLNLQTKSADIATVQILDLAGNPVLTEPYKETIDVSTLQSGIYVLYLKDKQGLNLEAKRLIKK